MAIQPLGQTAMRYKQSHLLADRYPVPEHHPILISYVLFPTFPNIGGAAAIPGWNSAQCGSCWQLTFQGKSILVTAIDHADDGFNLSQEALDTLTGGRAVEFGAVDVTATQVDKSQCGI